MRRAAATMLRRLAPFLLALTLACLNVSSVLAHASLLSSNPADDTLLRTSPPTLTLSFNEPVQPQVLRLIDGSGRAMALTAIQQHGNSLVVTPPSVLAPGLHVLSYRVVSEDGHPVGGTVTFFVGHRETARGAATGETVASVAVGLWICRLIVHLGLFIGCGGAFFLTWIAPERGRQAMRIVRIASIASLPFLLFAVGLQGLDLRGGSLNALSDPALWSAALRSSFGAFVACAALALLAALLATRSSAGVARSLSMLALVATGFAFAATGHAASANPRWLTGPMVFIHGATLAFWIGALPALALAMRQQADTSLAALARFSKFIPLAVLPAIAAGVVVAIVQLGRADALLTTAYGRILLIKLLLVALLLALAAFNRYRLTGRIVRDDAGARRTLRRSIVVELLLVTAIVALVGLWRFTPPPRLLATAETNFFTHLHAEQAMANITVAPARAGTNTVTIQLQTPDERLLAARELEVTLTNAEAGIEPIVRRASLGQDGQWRATFALPLDGRWSIGLDILVSDFERISLEAPILIGPQGAR